MTKPKILLLDIETAPSLVHVWGLWDQNVAINQIVKPGYTLCYAAKWYGSDKVMFDSIYKTKPKKMFTKLHKLLEEADAVIHYNGDRFDLPTIQKDFIIHGIAPPSPSKQIDLLKQVKKQFRFPSNKLDYVSQALGVGKKVKHEGHDLWVACMENDPVAWVKMQEYNEGDVLLLEQVYEKLKPWIKGHINYSLYSGGEVVCPVCGSNHYQSRGEVTTHSNTYHRYQCQACFKWFRGVKALSTGNSKRVVDITV